MKIFRLFLLFALLLYVLSEHVFAQPKTVVTTLGEVVTAPPKFSKYIYDSLEILNIKPGKELRFDIKPSPWPRLYLLQVDTSMTIDLEGFILVRPKFSYTIYDNSMATYIGNGWIINNNVKGHLNNSITFSNTKDNAIVFDFIGSGIEWIGERLKTHGKASVSIDNGEEIIVDSYINLKNGENTSLQYQQVLYSKLLPYGAHRIKVRIVGGGYVVHDGFKVRK